MARVKKSITLSPEAMELAQQQANILFAGNISAYLNFIIMSQRKKTDDKN